MGEEIPDINLEEIADGGSIPQDVLADFENYKENYSPQWLGNFIMKLPGESWERNVETGPASFRAKAELHGNNTNDSNSKLRRRQSLVEFLRTVRETVIALGLLGKLEELQKESARINQNRHEIMTGNDKDAEKAIREASSEVQERINSVVGIRTYFRLRVMGYNRSPDLI